MEEKATNEMGQLKKQVYRIGDNVFQPPEARPNNTTPSERTSIGLSQPRESRTVSCSGAITTRGQHSALERYLVQEMWSYRC
ncbi:hypothetical protein PoB_001255200 [Plakobranchus ocellatus]|uniref:Uncharacterized protein n=1 Tax=Plakobranchus ocellatus TaxID=259542 RepID=A0AAV3YV72_9GAST|nr:hypothetical protein PoB_001255200 [Plakobranchus ocellatus]